ncbi:MAG: molybdopterin-containing oxidoreductase family protein [Thermodesulfobacteriota bacterium]
MNRRDFIKYCLVGTQTLLFPSLLSLPAHAKEELGGKQVSRHTKRPLKGIPSICQLCPARCGIIGFLEGDRLIKIGGNSKHPNSLGKLCARGLAGVNLAYDPERITHPMIRRGERGKGQWERIPWDKAYSEISSRLKGIHQSGKKGGFVFQSEHPPEGLVKRFMDQFGKAMVIHEDSLYWGNRNWGQWLTWGEERGIPDLANSHYIVNFGANPYETHEFYTGLVGRLIQAKVQRKAKLVTFDVRLSHTAGNSDEWFPITPGTDGVVALAMAHVIVNDNLHDKDFIQKWTNLHPHELAKHLSPYTPENAQKISGVHASDIERIAREFAISRPSVAISGRGVSGHFNGVYNERCIFLLNVVVGNIDALGGYCLPRRYLTGESGWDRPSIEAREWPPITPQRFISSVKKGKLSPEVYFLYESNPVFNNPETQSTMEVLKNEKLIPYLIVAESYMTETAQYADIILPVATYLESWNLDSSPALGLVPFVALQQPIIRPYGQSVSISDIFIELAHRIGGGLQKYFKFNSTEEYIKKFSSGIGKLERAGGLNYLKQFGVWFDPKEKPKYRTYELRKFNTPSGKIEIYSERLKKMGFHPHPVYEPIPGHGDLKGKFVLITFEPNVMGARTGNFQWLAEIKHKNPIWLNRDVAKQLHIEEGDRVKISTKLGSFEAEARLTFGIHPRAIGIERNLGHWGFGNIAQGKKFKSKDPNTSLVWWGKEGHGLSPNRVIYGNSDPIGGGEGWNDTLVFISKA